MNGPTLTSDVLLTSAAGEYLAAAELAIRGWQVCMSPHQPSFDIAAVKGQKIRRVQVKTSAKPIPKRAKIQAAIHLAANAGKPRRNTQKKNAT